MLQNQKTNLSPGIELATAHFLKDAQLAQEYQRCLAGPDRAESPLARALRMPKVRQRILEFTRLFIFGLFLCVGIAAISSMGLWRHIYHALITAL